MAIKRRDFQKLSSTVQEFLLKLPDEETSARLRDNLLHSLHFLQLYYRVLQNRDKNSSNENGTSLQWTIDHSLSPLTPFREAPDKFEWEWINVESQKVRASIPKLATDSYKTLPPIINAIKDGDLDTVRNLTRSESSLVNTTDVFARDCCMYAVHYDRIEILKFLIDNGANVNQVSSDSSTCLHIAAYKGNPDIVELLLKSKANINAQDSFNRSPLHWAIVNPDMDCLRVLLKHNCNILIRDKDGMSPSMWACYLDHLDHLKLLHNIDPASNKISSTNNDHMETDNDGRTWLHWSVRKNEPLNCLNFLLNEKTFLVRDKEGKTCLHVAAELGAIQACKLIIEELGVGVANERDSKKQTPLHLATLNGQARAIKMLIDNGADPFLKDTTGASPIDYVTKRNLFFCNSIIEICLRNQERRQRRGAGSTNSIASTSSDPTNLTPAPPSIPKNPAYSRSFQYNQILTKEPNHSRHFHSGRPPRPINTTSFSNSVDNSVSLNASTEMTKTAPASLNNIVGADELNDYGSHSASNLLMTRQPSPPPPRPGGILRGGWNSNERVMSGSLRLSRASTRTSLASDDLDKYLNGTLVNSHNNIDNSDKNLVLGKPNPQPRIPSSNSASNLRINSGNGNNNRPFDTTVSAASFDLATPSTSSQVPPPIKPRKSSSLASLNNPNLDSSLSNKYNQSIENLNQIKSSSSTSQAPVYNHQSGYSSNLVGIPGTKMVNNHHHFNNNKSHPMHQHQVDVEDLSGDEEQSLTSMKGEGFASDLSDNEERSRHNRVQQQLSRTKSNKKSASHADPTTKRPQTPLDLRQDQSKRQPTAAQQQNQQPYTRFNEWDPYKGNSDRQKSPQKSKGSANLASQTNNFAYTFLGQDASPRQTSGRTANNSTGTLSAGNSMIESTSATNLDLMVSGQRVGPPRRDSPTNNTPRTDDLPSGKQQTQSQSQRPFTRRLKPLDNAPTSGEVNLNSSGENQFLRQKTSKTTATDRKKLEPLKGSGTTTTTSQVDSITGDDHSYNNTIVQNNMNNDEEPSISENTFSNSEKQQLFKTPKNKKVFSSVLKYT